MATAAKTNADPPLDPTEVVERSVDPLPLLGISAVQVRHITELQLCKKGQTSIHPNLQLFTNLETLWLSDNKLRRVENLTPKRSGKHVPVTEDIRGCFRLKRLYLTNNKIVTLTGDIEKLKYLEVLLLANNLLSNMEAVSAQLKHLGRLQQLDLFGNPLSEEQRYRPYFIYHHPSIQVLDRRHVTDEERAEAEQMFRQTSAARNEQSTYVFGGSIRLDDIPPVDRVGEISLSVALLETKVKAIKARKHAEEVQEASREQTLLEEIASKRKAFHGIWEFAGRDPIAVPQFNTAVSGTAAGAKGSAVPSPAPASQKASPAVVSPDATNKDAKELPPIVTRDRFQSKIFTASGDQDKHVNAIRRLVELQEQLEASRLDAQAGERTLRLVKELRQLRHLMVPERLGDTFNDVLASKKATTFNDDMAEYLRRMSQEVFILPHELANLRKMFPAETAPNFNSDSVEGLLGALDRPSGGGPSLAAAFAADLGESFRANGGLLGEKERSNISSKKKAAGSSGQPQADKTSEEPLDLKQALALLVCHLPFARARAEYLVEFTNKLLLKEAQPDAAKAYFAKINDANEHVRLLERQQQPLSAAGKRFVTLAALSQSVVGSLF